jgi:hypothetical protein
MDIIDMDIFQNIQMVINQLHMYYFILIIQRMNLMEYDLYLYWYCLNIYENVNIFVLWSI